MTVKFDARLVANLVWSRRDEEQGSVICDNNSLRHLLEWSTRAELPTDATWHRRQYRLQAGQSLLLELDLLEQPCFGSSVLVPFVAVKALMIINHSQQAELIIRPASVDGWLGPFDSFSSAAKIPAHGLLLVAHCQEGWQVELGANSLEIVAAGAEAVFDVAIVGSTSAAGTGQSSSTVSDSSSTTSSDSSSETSSDYSSDSFSSS